MKNAIIFAAGSGTRLGSLTEDIPKPLIKFHNKTIIEHIIDYLLKLKTIKEIIVVTGYQLEKFQYLISKYQQVKIIINNFYDVHNTGFALTFVQKYFVDNDVFIISGDFIMLENCFFDGINKNVMAAMIKTTNKTDWCYQLDKNGNIETLVKTSNKKFLLASEWTHVTKEWAKIIAKDLSNEKTIGYLKENLLGNYLIEHAKKNNIALKPFLISNNAFWDLDQPDDLVKLQNK